MTRPSAGVGGCVASAPSQFIPNKFDETPFDAVVILGIIQPDPVQFFLGVDYRLPGLEQVLVLAVVGDGLADIPGKTGEDLVFLQASFNISGQRGIV
jgi:hypothetical protein